VRTDCTLAFLILASATTSYSIWRRMRSSRVKWLARIEYLDYFKMCILLEGVLSVGAHCTTCATEMMVEMAVEITMTDFMIDTDVKTVRQNAIISNSYMNIRSSIAALSARHLLTHRLRIRIYLDYKELRAHK
jgi:hypothetical protein